MIDFGPSEYCKKLSDAEIYLEKTIFISKIQGFDTGIFIHCHSTGTVFNCSFREFGFTVTVTVQRKSLYCNCAVQSSTLVTTMNTSTGLISKTDTEMGENGLE